MVDTNIQKLISILEELREKCPWDKKQTIHSLRQMTIEEVYELTEAITSENWSDIKEELGDVLLHLLFYAKIATEQNQFTFGDVIDAICSKLIKRHPHIYPESANAGLVEVKSEEDVKRNWERIKLQEGKKSTLSGVPKGLPATIKAMRLQEKAKQVGFEWENKNQVWQKVQEELNELQEAIKTNVQKNIEDEFGDVVFSLINYARFLNIDAENALELTNKKFMDRFTKMEMKAVEMGTSLDKLSLEQMDDIWNTIKQQKPA